MTEPADDAYGDSYHVLDLLAALAESWLMLLVIPILSGLVAFGAVGLRSSVAEQSWGTVTMVAPKSAVDNVRSAPFLSQIEEAAGLGGLMGLSPEEAARTAGGLINASLDTSGRFSLVVGPGERALIDPLTQVVVDGVTRLSLNDPSRTLAENMLADYNASLAVATTDLSELRAALGLEEGDVPPAATGTAGQDYAGLSELHRAVLEWKLAIRNLENYLGSLPDGTITTPARVETSAQSANVAMPVVLSAVAGLILAAILAIVRDAWRRAAISAGTSEKVARIRRAFGLRAAQPASNAKN